MHDLFHLFLQGNRSSTPSEASLDAPGEELPNVRTIHSADGSADAGKPSSRVRGLKNRALKFVYLLNFVYKQILKQVGSNVKSCDRNVTGFSYHKSRKYANLFTFYFK